MIEQEGRRRFLEKAGKIAVTAPAAALLLSASGQFSMASAYGGGNGGPRGNNGFGNGGTDGTPNGFPDGPR